MEQTGGLDEEGCHDHRHHKLHHSLVNGFAPELMILQFHLVGDPLGLHDPAHEDGREQAGNGHQAGIGDVVHNVKQLANGTVGQCDFKVEYIVAQADNDRADSS